MKKMTRKQINAIPLTDKEKKSNEALAFLTKVAIVYNQGWTPSNDDRGYIVFSMCLFYDGDTTDDRASGLKWINARDAYRLLYAPLLNRLAFYNPDPHIIKEYKQEWLDLFMVEQ